MSLSTHKLLKINSNDKTDNLSLEFVLCESNNDLYTLELKTSFQVYITEINKNITINTTSFVESIDKMNVKVRTKKEYQLNDTSAMIDHLINQIMDLKNKLKENKIIVIDENNVEIISDDEKDDDRSVNFTVEDNKDDDDDHSVNFTVEDNKDDDDDRSINFTVEDNKDDDDDRSVFKIEDYKDDDDDRSVNDDLFTIEDNKDDDDKDEGLPIVFKNKDNIKEINDILIDTTKISIELDEIVKNLKKNVTNEPLIKSVIENSIDIKNIENVNDDTQKKENQLLYHLKFLLSVGDVSLSGNMIYLVTQMMKFVEKFNLNGDEKKKLILSTLEKYLYNVDLQLGEKHDYILSTICPELIDILISVDSRKIKIRKQFKCFPWK